MAYDCECPTEKCKRIIPGGDDEGKDEWYEIQDRNGFNMIMGDHWVIAKTCNWNYKSDGYKLIEEGKICILVAKADEEGVD